MWERCSRLSIFTFKLLHRNNIRNKTKDIVGRHVTERFDLFSLMQIFAIRKIKLILFMNKHLERTCLLKLFQRDFVVLHCLVNGYFLGDFVCFNINYAVFVLLELGDSLKVQLALEIRIMIMLK